MPKKGGSREVWQKTRLFAGIFLATFPYLLIYICCIPVLNDLDGLQIFTSVSQLQLTKAKTMMEKLLVNFCENVDISDY